MKNNCAEQFLAHVKHNKKQIVVSPTIALNQRTSPGS
jgi:hypothetical protein